MTRLEVGIVVVGIVQQIVVIGIAGLRGSNGRRISVGFLEGAFTMRNGIKGAGPVTKIVKDIVGVFRPC